VNKRELTKLFLNNAGLDSSTESIHHALHEWWHTPLSPVGLRLTHTGAVFLKKTLNLSHYTCTIKKDYQHTLRLILSMNKHFASPFYFYEAGGSKKIECFGETDATMLIMMDGDLQQYLENFER